MKLSIIIPVLYEADRINSTLESVLSQTDDEMEVIVVDGDVNRSTINTINHPDVIRVSGAPGRGVQMNTGAKTATGEILLFLHADTTLPEKALQQIIQLMKNQAVDAGAFELTIAAKGFAFRVIETLATLRSRLNRIPFGDQAIFIKNSEFIKLGGFREIPVMEDLDLMKRMKHSGKKIKILESGVSTSARRWEQEGILCCTLRNWTILLMYRFGASPARLAKFYKKFH